MKDKHIGPQLDQRDPAVARFAQECGLATNAVSVRLVGVSAEDVSLQIKRLEKTFGALILMSQPRQSGKGTEWIAYGTLIG